MKHRRVLSSIYKHACMHLCTRVPFICHPVVLLHDPSQRPIHIPSAGTPRRMPGRSNVCRIPGRPLARPPPARYLGIGTSISSAISVSHTCPIIVIPPHLIHSSHHPRPIVGSLHAHFLHAPSFLPAGRASPELRAAVLGDLVTSGQGRWLGPDRRRLLVLWKSPGAWAETLFGWARQSGLEGSVVSFEELVAGDEVRGSPIEGLPRELLRLAIKVLEDAGKAKVFKGGEGDDIGVKFF